MKWISAAIVFGALVGCGGGGAPVSSQSNSIVGIWKQSGTYSKQAGATIQVCPNSEAPMACGSRWQFFSDGTMKTLASQSRQQVNVEYYFDGDTLVFHYPSGDHADDTTSFLWRSETEFWESRPGLGYWEVWLKQ